MTTHKSNLWINERLNAEFILELEKDLSSGHWNGEIIFSDFEILEFYDNDGEKVSCTPCLQSQFLVKVEREFYSPNRRTTLYDDCLNEFYEDQGIVVRREVA